MTNDATLFISYIEFGFESTAADCVNNCVLVGEDDDKLFDGAAVAFVV